jgi:hypothetical protein
MWHHTLEKQTPHIQASYKILVMSHMYFHQNIKKSSGNGRSKGQNKILIISLKIIVLKLIMQIQLQVTSFSFPTGRQAK